MKRLIVLSLICLMILSGCGKEQPVSPNIGTDGPAATETPVATDQVYEGEVDISILESTPANGSSGQTVTGSSGTVTPETPNQGASQPTEVTNPTTEESNPTVESSEPTTSTEEPTESTETTTPTGPVKDADGYFNQVVRP